MKHCRCRNAQFTVAVHANSELKGVTDRHHALILTKAAPEVNIRQNDVDTSHLNARSQLFPGHKTHIRREWNTRGLTDLTHAFQVPGWVFEIFEFDVFRFEPSQNLH